MPRARDTGVRCFCCRGPFHPATGGLHWVEFTQRWVPWCGACERDFIGWFGRHSRGRKRRVRRGGKTVVLRFYDHAGPPEED